MSVLAVAPRRARRPLRRRYLKIRRTVHAALFWLGFWAVCVTGLAVLVVSAGVGR